MMIAVVAAATGCAHRPERRLQTSFAESKHAANIPAIWPVECGQCRLTSVFGETRPTAGGGTRPHNGIDLAAPKGTPVFAAADGQVYFTGRDGNYGKTLRIAHPGNIQTWYCHLKSIKAKIGQWVARGQYIGRVGDTGNVTGPHLHYEIRIGNKPMDPLKYLPKSNS
jgi:murein DD-endopeptidase MepM/ murein hydrolase activator NlpD